MLGFEGILGVGKLGLLKVGGDCAISAWDSFFGYMNSEN
jgi:hypothetical protein